MTQSIGLIRMIVCVWMFLAVPVSANLLEVKKAVENAQCKKLAVDYANDPRASTIQSIAQLQICLAQTLKVTAAAVKPKDFNIQPPSSSTKKFDTTLPTPPTLPTLPQAIEIP